MLGACFLALHAHRGPSLFPALRASTLACVFYALRIFFFFSMLWGCFFCSPHASRSANVLYTPCAFSSFPHSAHVFLPLCGSWSTHLLYLPHIFSSFPCFTLVFLCSVHITVRLCLLLHAYHHRPLFSMLDMHFLLFQAPCVFSCAPAHHHLLMFSTLGMYFLLFYALCVFCYTPCVFYYTSCASRFAHVFYTPCIFSSFPRFVHVLLCPHASWFARVFCAHVHFLLLHASRLFSYTPHASRFALVFYAPLIFSSFLCFAHITVSLCFLRSVHVFVFSTLHTCFLALRLITACLCFLCLVRIFFFSTFCTFSLALPLVSRSACVFYGPHVFSYFQRSMHVFFCAPCTSCSACIFIFRLFTLLLHVCTPALHALTY